MSAHRRSGCESMCLHVSEGTRNCGLRLGVYPEFGHESSLIPTIHTASSSAPADGMAIDFFVTVTKLLHLLTHSVFYHIQ